MRDEKDKRIGGTFASIIHLGEVYGHTGEMLRQFIRNDVPLPPVEGPDVERGLAMEPYVRAKMREDGHQFEEVETLIFRPSDYDVPDSPFEVRPRCGQHYPRQKRCIFGPRRPDFNIHK